MDEPRQNIAEKVQEAITLNTRKGELYRMAFAGDPDRIIEGIPVSPTTSEMSGERAFDLKIQVPEEQRGRIVRCAIEDVVLLEKV